MSKIYLIFVISIYSTLESNNSVVCGSDLQDTWCKNLTSGRPCTETWTIPILHNDSFSCETVQDKLDCTYADRVSKKIFIQNTYCMTLDEYTNVTFVGKCPYNQHPYTHIRRKYFVQLPSEVEDLNSFMCNGSTNEFSGYNFCKHQNRKGLLCSLCHDGLGPAVLSYTHECRKCYWYGWLLYGVVVFLPATVLCLMIILLRIDTTEPYMNSIVLFCHVVINVVNSHPCSFFQCANHIKLLLPAVFVVTIYGLFNMDFFPYLIPPFCVSETMSIMQVKLLDYVIAIYPLFFTALIYVLIEFHDSGCRVLVCLWKPFHKCIVQWRRSWNIKGSVINAFATLYLLSFTKIASVSYSLLVTTELANICGERNIFLYYEPSCEKLTRCHLLYVACSLTVLCIFIIIPTLYLFFHSFKVFQCYFSYLHTKFPFLNEITKVFCKNYKDHTNARIDCRWFVSIHLSLRIAIVFTQVASYNIVWQLFFVCSAVILVATFRPYHNDIFNCMDLITLSIMAFSIVVINSLNLWYVILFYFLPFCCIVLLICYKIKLLFSSLKLKQNCLKLLKRMMCLSSGIGLLSNDLLVQPREYHVSEQHPLINAGETAH